MQIQAVQNNNIRQNMPVFNGYIDRSLKSYIRDITKQAIKDHIQLANKSARRVNTKSLDEIKELGSGILTKLQQYADKTHPKTYAALEHVPGTEYSSLGYPVLTGKVRFVFKHNNTDDFIQLEHLTLENINNIRVKDIREHLNKTFNNNKYNEAGIYDLRDLNRQIIDLVDHTNPHEIDLKLLDAMNKEVRYHTEHADNWFKRLILNYKAKITQRFANEIGEPTNKNVKDWSNIRVEAAKANKAKKGAKAEIQQIIKENNAIQREYLKF